MRCKQAQFFILAAVILSVIIISLGAVSNKATINREPDNFYDYTYEMKKESGAIMDWELYSDFEIGANLTAFVDLLAADTVDKYPNANFLFVYGNDEVLKLRNYGVEDASVDGQEVEGANEQRSGGISTDFSSLYLTASLSQYGDWEEVLITNFNEEFLEIEISGQDFNFKVSNDNQVLFILQRNEGGESYVAIE